MINFYLPNFYEWKFKILNTYFIVNIREHPEFFYDNINIGAVYGTFPGVIWNGGRAMIGSACVVEVPEIIEYYQNLNIPIRFTYTNTLIQESHLNDAYANFVTTLADNGNNEILVNSPLLEEYLRTQYPNYKFLSSTTKCLTESSEIIKESEQYYLTVLDYKKNIDKDFLINLENKEKYELLINAYCDPKCLFRQEHYNRLSQMQLNNNFDIQDIPCNKVKHSFFDSLQFPTVIKVEDLYSYYNKELGFIHFKIEGRTNHFMDVLESYLYYMVKPEYQTQIRYDILRNQLPDIFN